MWSIVLTGIVVSLSAAQTGDELHAWVRGIEGKSPEGRRGFVKAELRNLGVDYRTGTFSRTLKFNKEDVTIVGENIIVPMGRGTQNILVGAHVDAIPGSPGANDNGGGVAVVLGLIRWARSADWNHRITFCFFDQEESGLIGSREFVKTYADSSVHLAMINLDVEGMGDALFVGPVGGGDDDFLMPIVRRAADRIGAPYHETGQYPPSDHLSFGGRNLENISVSVVPSADAPLLIETVARGWGMEPDRMPQVLKFMHTPRDSSVYVSPGALALSFGFVKGILSLLNETPSPVR
jgi:aminopeptidase YwaD